MPRPADMPTLRGLPNPNTTPLPNCIVDEYLPFFTGAELKVILYLVRRTLGFHKTRDAISLNQICNGIVRKDGRRLDRGTGLHKSTACDALNTLAGWGMIKRMTRRDPARGDLPTEYTLWIEGEIEEEAVEARAGGNGSGASSTPGPVASAPERRARTGPPQRETTPLPLSAPPDRGDKTIHPVSGQPDTPLSVRRDTPVLGQPDRQNPASQEQYEQDRSNTRHSHHALAKGERRGRSSSMTTDAVVGRLPSGDQTPQTGTASRGGGTRDDCLPSASPIGAIAAGDPTRETLHHFAEVVAREFNDRAPFRATLSRLVNLYHRADLPTDAFAERFDAARQRTKERTAAIRPPLRGAANERAAKNKMPYFFALLEESLGLREEIALPATAAAHDAPAVRDIPPAVIPGVPPAGETSEVARPGDTPSRHLLPATAPTDMPPPMADTDAQIIGAVVREFSRQFAEYATAVALADWAVALWRGSGLSRRHFLELAGAASEEMVRETSEAASAPLFRTRLAATLGQSSDAEGASMPSAPEYRSSSVLPSTDVGRHEE